MFIVWASKLWGVLLVGWVTPGQEVPRHGAATPLQLRIVSSPLGAVDKFGFSSTGITHVTCFCEVDVLHVLW